MNDLVEMRQEYFLCFLVVSQLVAYAERLQDAIRDQEEYFFRNHTELPRLQGGVSAIVLSFNHRENIDAISQALQNEDGVQEIVVAEDGSTDGSLEKWRSVLRKKKDHIAITSDIHEIRAYNNAALRYANASILCFLQDDDIPSDPGWAQEVIDLMNAFRTERLGLMSGLASEVCQVELGEQQVEHPPSMKNFKKTQPIPYTYKKIPFMFTTEAWLSPLCIRRDVFLELSGFDQSLTKPGEPGIGLDIHLSLRAALRGYTIGLHGAKFKRGIGGHGTVSDPKKQKLRLCKRAEISARIRMLAGCRWPPPFLFHAASLNQRFLDLRSNIKNNQAKSTPQHQRLIDDIYQKCKPFLSRPCRFDSARFAASPKSLTSQSAGGSCS